MPWLVVSIVLSVILTVVLNVGLRLFPGAGRRAADGMSKLAGPPPDAARCGRRAGQGVGTLEGDDPRLVAPHDRGEPRALAGQGMTRVDVRTCAPIGGPA